MATLVSVICDRAKSVIHYPSASKLMSDAFNKGASLWPWGLALPNAGTDGEQNVYFGRAERRTSGILVETQEGDFANSGRRALIYTAS
jgi:hypothetical protein